MMQVFLFLTLVVSYISGKNYLIIKSQTGIQCQKEICKINKAYVAWTQGLIILYFVVIFHGKLIDSDVMSSGYRKISQNNDKGNTTIKNQENVKIKNFKDRQFGKGDKAKGRNLITKG